MLDDPDVQHHPIDIKRFAVSKSILPTPTQVFRQFFKFFS